MTILLALTTANFSRMFAIKHIPERVIISTFILMVTLSLLRYSADLLNLL